MKQKTQFIFGGVWELLRFFLLFLSVLSVYLPVIQMNEQAVLWMILIGSAQLLFPPAYVLIAVNPTKYRSLMNFLCIGKIMSIFLVSIFLILHATGISIGSIHVRFLAKPVSLYWLLFAVLIFDLIFLFVLLSYRGNSGIGHSGNDRLINERPDFHVADTGIRWKKNYSKNENQDISSGDSSNSELQ